MARSATAGTALPSARAVLELSKPVTWFPPMWAFGCGVVSSGEPLSGATGAVLAGLVLAGPLLCATSQAVNDWYDRHVDALNEPHRPIPSGRIPGRWGLYLAIGWTAASAAWAAALGPWILASALLGLALAWAYSAPPLRLKRNGWWGNAAVALSYEGLAWITGAALLAGTLADPRIVTIAVLYSAGAHGIMTLNDFKSIDGDRRMGIRSLPVQLGVSGAARVACVAMAVPQALVIALLAAWGATLHAGIVGVLLLVQLVLMGHFLRQPRERARWYSALGINFYVLGMLASAFALRAMHAGGA